MANEMPYIVINPDGVTVLQSLVRHPRRVELDLLEHGYTIKLNGGKLTKTELRREVKPSERIPY